MSVKDRLEAYRRKRRKEKMIEALKNIVRNMFLWNRNSGTEKSIIGSTKDEEVQLCEKSQNAEEDLSEDNTQESKNTVINKVIYLLYFLLWIILYVIALEYEFGAVYFVLSAFVFIWLNTRSGPKKQGEPSAYSVFNPNCEAIEGTLDASQLEREMMYGIGIR